MEMFYFGIIGFLFVLAIFDLVVGVSNDAVNFLSSAVGAKVAPFRTIIIIAATGVLAGALFSNGMMEIARSGIYQPAYFGFVELLTICLAVMVTDVVLLDLFNSLGLPTSTTVSMVFELLGGAFALSLLKTMNNPELSLGDLLNTSKALSVIMGIFLSVAIAFFFGSLVQWLARLLFTFRYKPRMKWFGGLFGGVAATAILYFVLIKGLKDSAFMTPENKEWVQLHTAAIVGWSLVGFSLLMQLLQWLKVNIFKVVILMGTFALAMAFAGNDLVNFVGVPLAGYAAWQEYSTAGAYDPDFLMGALAEPAKTPFFFLLFAGVVMVIALCTSKKAHNVIKTSVDLARQSQGDEMFGSSLAARALVRASHNVAEVVERITPKRVGKWIDARFQQDAVSLPQGAAFDELRASINLLLAAALIALGTSLKLPLSTTYVTFMVAMGSSLADRAWGRESAVYRITGVMSVVGGWFLTAGAAFTLAFLVALLMHWLGGFGMVAMILLAIFVLFRSNRRFSLKSQPDPEENLYRQMAKTEDPNERWILLKQHSVSSISHALSYASEAYLKLTNGLMREELKSVRRAVALTRSEKEYLKRIRRRELMALRGVELNLIMEKNTWFHVQSNCCEQLYYTLKRASEPVLEHMENNFNPLPSSYVKEFQPLRNALDHLIARVRRSIQLGDYSTAEQIASQGEELRGAIQSARTTQMFRIHHDKPEQLKVSLLYLNLLSESQELLSSVLKLHRAANRFHA
uniref:anion permease n=1 Tax=Alistipes sp. TaxID=1872444 RepID=UPI0040577307